MSTGWCHGRRVSHSLIGIVLAWGAGCGGEMEQGGFGVPEFPEAEEIQRIKDQPLPAEDRVFADVGLDLEQWELEGPLPSRTSTVAYRGNDIASRVLAQQVQAYGTDARTTEGMACVAHQVGKLMLAHGQTPSSTLEGFILARCGAAVGGVDLLTWRTSQGRLDDAAAEPMIEDAFAHPRRELGGHPDSVLGAWYGGTEHESLLVLAHGRATLGLAPVPMDARGLQYVTVQGTKPRGVELVTGVATSGESGFGTCRVVEGEDDRSRAFTLHCPVLASDSATLIDLVENRRRRALGSRAATLFVSPDGTLPGTYREPRFASVAAVDAASASQIGETINDLRLVHGLGPVALEVAQSQEVSALLPHFMAAIHDDSQADVADTIMLHLIGGRYVESAIRDAQCLHFTTTTEAGKGVDRAIVRETLFPMVRSTLLDPKAQSIAIGVRANEAGDVAAVMLSTYDQVDAREYPLLDERLFAQLDRARAERGLPPATRLPDAESNAVLDHTMGRLELGTDLEGVLDSMLERISRVYPELQVGYTLEGIDPDDARVAAWPEALLDAETAGVLLRVGQYAVRGSRWVVELVVITYVVPPSSPVGY